VPLSEGQNKIQVSTHNQNAVESYKETVYVKYSLPKGNESKPNLYLVTIGVSKYKEQNMNLKYAAKDGRDIIQTFQSNTNNLWKEVYIDSLFNESVNVSNIGKIKQNLLNSKVDDLVILFVSGHGLLDDSLDFYYASHEMDFDKPNKYGIPYDLLEGLLDSIPARKKVMLIDACHSGEVDKEELIVLNTNTSSNSSKGLQTIFTHRGGNNQHISKKRSKTGLKNSFELMQELFADLSRSSGSVVISAAAGEGYAYEDDKWQNGAFTYTLLNGLKNGLANADSKNGTTINEVKNYVLNEVEKITNGKQKPTVRNDNLEFDFRVW